MPPRFNSKRAMVTRSAVMYWRATLALICSGATSLQRWWTTVDAASVLRQVCYLDSSDERVTSADAALRTLRMSALVVGLPPISGRGSAVKPLRFGISTFGSVV